MKIQNLQKIRSLKKNGSGIIFSELLMILVIKKINQTSLKKITLVCVPLIISIILKSE
jgi:hypothetical protein